MKPSLLILILYCFSWPSFGQLAGFTEKARKCALLIHAGCPITSRPTLTSTGFALMAENVKETLIKARSNFKTVIASIKSPRPGYHCDQPNFQEDVDAIMEIIVTAKASCIRYYSRNLKTNQFEKFDFDLDTPREANRAYPGAGLFVTQGNLCSPIGLEGVQGALSGKYGNPLLTCEEVRDTPGTEDEPVAKVDARHGQHGKAGAGKDKYSQLARLKELLDDGALTRAEFDAEKKKLLDSP